MWQVASQAWRVMGDPPLIFEHIINKKTKK